MIRFIEQSSTQNCDFLVGLQKSNGSQRFNFLRELKDHNCPNAGNILADWDSVQLFLEDDIVSQFTDSIVANTQDKSQRFSVLARHLKHFVHNRLAEVVKGVCIFISNLQLPQPPEGGLFDPDPVKAEKMLADFNTQWCVAFDAQFEGIKSMRQDKFSEFKKVMEKTLAEDWDKTLAANPNLVAVDNNTQGLALVLKSIISEKLMSAGLSLRNMMISGQTLDNILRNIILKARDEHKNVHGTYISNFFKDPSSYEPVIAELCHQECVHAISWINRASCDQSSSALQQMESSSQAMKTLGYPCSVVVTTDQGLLNVDAYTAAIDYIQKKCSGG